MQDKDSEDEFLFGDPLSSWWPFIIAVLVGVATTIRGYFGGPTCPSQATVKGKTIVITGGSSGVGLEVVVELLKRGGKVIIGARDPDSVKVEIDNIRKSRRIAKTAVSVVKKLDVSSLKSVRDFVAELDETKVDILINNAGIMFHPFSKTSEGFETHLVTNYLSHFLLTHLLIPKLQAAGDARIINVSAQAHYVGDIFLDDMNLETDFTSNKAFGQSKLSLVLMTKFMAKLFEGTNITINAMHPGIVRGTKHMRYSPFSASKLLKIIIAPWAWLLMKTPIQGAQTIIYLAVATELSRTTGKYFSNCGEVAPSEKANDILLATNLYKKSLQLVGLL